MRIVAGYFLIHRLMVIAKMSHPVLTISNHNNLPDLAKSDVKHYEEH